jgi:hypothetical protein
MVSLADNVKKAFHAGNFPAVLSSTVYGSEGRSYAPECIPYAVSALAAVGQLKEAELTLALKFEELDPDQQVFVYYHLAVANINAGRFPDAARFVIKASRLRFLFKEPVSNFYMFMALAYFRYAGGKARQGQNFAFRAGGFLSKNTGSYPLFLWLELMGNLSFLAGDVANAEDYAADAVRCAAELDRQGSVRALRMSLILHKARQTRDAAAAIATLEKAYSELGPLESFLKASLCFESVRHNASIGRTDAGHKVYRQGLAHAARFSSRRMDIVKLLRQVDLHIAERQFHMALPLLDMLDAHLLKDEDRLYLAETLDKKAVVCFALNLNKQSRDAEDRLNGLIRTTGIYVPRLPKPGIAAAQPLSVTGNLNYRQIAFLAEMEGGKSVDVHDYRQRFGVSEITACRDLSQLTSDKYLIRVGKARATRYIKPDDQYVEIVRSAQMSMQESADTPALPQ